VVILGALGIALVAFAIILGGAFGGASLRKLLPEHHLTAETKDLIRLGTGLIGTIAALVLGLLIATAKNSYDTQSANVQRIAADVILLDEILAQYGPEAQPARGQLRQFAEALVKRIWQENRSKDASRYATTAAGEQSVGKILQLAPQNDAQRMFKERAINAFVEVAQTRLALLVQAGNSLPLPFLVVLIFWLAIIFASFGLFAQLNPLAITALFVFALSAAGAVFLVLELSDPFTGLMQISSATLRNALAPL
jgi:hypothetical protein